MIQMEKVENPAVLHPYHPFIGQLAYTTCFSFRYLQQKALIGTLKYVTFFVLKLSASTAKNKFEKIWQQQNYVHSCPLIPTHLPYRDTLLPSS